LASGLLRPGIGSVRVFGKSPVHDLDVRRRVGLCPDVDRFYESMSGLSWVTFMAKLAGLDRPRARAAAALERLGMADRMRKRIGGYSKGMRQRTKLARAIVGDSELLLLDEPLNGLDPVGREEVIAFIQELGRSGKAVLVSSHVLSEVERMTPNLLLIHQGRVLAEGKVGEIRDQIADQAYRVELRASDLRGLAQFVIGLPSVEGVEVIDGRVIVRVHEADGFFDSVTELGADARFGLEAVTPLDAGLEAVFDYLVR